MYLFDVIPDLKTEAPSTKQQYSCQLKMVPAADLY